MRPPRAASYRSESSRFAGGLRGRLVRRQALPGQHVLQFAGLEHLADNIATADELALHIELWDRRPVGIVLDALADGIILEHVDALIGHSEVVEDLNDLT
jgi:hypothetical protein